MNATDKKASNEGTLFTQDALGSPLEEAFRDLGRILPSGRQVSAVAWQCLRKPAFWKAAGALVVLLTAWTWGPSWAAWAGAKAQQGGSATVDVASGAGRAVANVLSVAPGAGFFKAERAAYYVSEDVAAMRARAGDAKVGLALHPDTALFRDYRVDFYARLDGKPLRWVARAADAENHYAYSIVRKGKRLLLQVQTVAGGEAVETAEPVELEESLLVDGFNKVTVVSVSNAVTTLVNGQGVHHVKHLSRADGAVGVFLEGDERRFGEITVRANDDVWGRLLAEARGLARL